MCFISQMYLFYRFLNLPSQYTMKKTRKSMLLSIYFSICVTNHN
ncbi:hypothetical protein CMALT394_770009 [Carnobacterium maltaromaticum]|nr:hypothetical protein CMALT394_770009 [Carnobacterium maltaromaticum]